MPSNSDKIEISDKIKKSVELFTKNPTTGLINWELQRYNNIVWRLDCSVLNMTIEITVNYQFVNQEGAFVFTLTCPTLKLYEIELESLTCREAAIEALQICSDTIKNTFDTIKNSIDSPKNSIDVQ